MPTWLLQERRSEPIIHSMRLTRYRLATLLCLLVLTSACSKHDSPGQTDAAASRLCQHIAFNRLSIVVDTNKAEIVWSDGRILECGTNFPSALQGIIARPDHYHDIRAFVAKLQADGSTGWRNASVVRTSNSDRYSTIRSSDGSVSVTVQSLYLEYLHERYPTASIRVKGQFDPILFLVGGELKASVMPVKL